MDINKMSIEDIEKMQLELEVRRQTLKEEELNQKKIATHEKINNLLQNRDIILSLIKHSRTSCSDDNVSNGYLSSQGYARCNKCHLIEIFDGYYDNGEFDVLIDVTISKVQ